MATTAIAYQSSAKARCARAKYVVSGVVRDCETKQPIPGAQVMVFLDDEASTWATTEGASPALGSDVTGSYHGGDV